MLVTTYGNTYQIIMGNRRYRACKSLGWIEIPAIVIKGTPDDDNWYMLSENLQRDDLTDSEKGKSVEAMRKTCALSNRELARKLGVPKSRVYYAINAYTKLSPEVQLLV